MNSWPGEVEDLGLELGDALGHPLADRRQTLGVDADPDPLHRRQDLDQRQLDLVQQWLEAELLEALALAVGELVREAGIDGRVAGGLALLGLERELAGIGAGRARPRGPRRRPAREARRPGGRGRSGRRRPSCRGPGRGSPRPPRGCPCPPPRRGPWRRGRPAGADPGPAASATRSDASPVITLLAVGGPEALRRRSPSPRARQPRSASEPSSAATWMCLVDLAVGDDLVELLLQPRDHLAQLELGRDVAQARAIGLPPDRLGRVDGTSTS